MLQQHRFGAGPYELDAGVAHHRLRDGGHAVLPREIRVASDLDRIRADARALDREPDGQADRPGAVGSGGCREDAQAHVLVERREARARLVGEAARSA